MAGWKFWKKEEVTKPEVEEELKPLPEPPKPKIGLAKAEAIRAEILERFEEKSAQQISALTLRLTAEALGAEITIQEEALAEQEKAEQEKSWAEQEKNHAKENGEHRLEELHRQIKEVETKMTEAIAVAEQKAETELSRKVEAELIAKFFA